MIAKVESHENIQVLKQAVVVDHTGIAGMFKTGVQVGPRMFYRQITHGITILATGALVNRPEEMLLGDHDGGVDPTRSRLGHGRQPREDQRAAATW